MFSSTVKTPWAPARKSLFIAVIVSVFGVGAITLPPPAPAYSAEACGIASPSLEPGGTGAAGSSTNRYVVSAAGNLAWIGERENVDGAPQFPARLGYHYIQSGPIDMSGCANWVPIGFSIDAPFRGIYDGGNHTITGFTVTTWPNPYTGLFGVLGGSSTPQTTVKNLRIEGATVVAPEPYAGVLAARTQGGTVGARIENVHISGSVVSTKETTTNVWVGGLIGRAEGAGTDGESGAIVRSSAAVSVRSSEVRGSFLGGLVGQVAGFRFLISESFATGSVTGTQSRFVGGLVGENDGNIFFSFATGDVRSGTRDQVGGLVGDQDDSSGIILDSYALGNVFVGDDKSETGGFAGRMADENTIIKRSFSAGSVTTTGGGPTTGGAFAGTTVTRALSDYVGFEDNFFDSSKTVPALAIARTTGVGDEEAQGKVTGRSTEQMKQAATFVDNGWSLVEGWAPFNPHTEAQRAEPDFQASDYQVWGICSSVNGGYPYLLWQFESNPCVAQASSAVKVQSAAIHLDVQARVGSPAEGTLVVAGGTGLKVGSNYSLILRSTPQVLASSTVSSLGGFSRELRLPTLSPGEHSATLTAVGPDGETLNLVQTFVVGSRGEIVSISSPTGTVTGGLAATGAPQGSGVVAGALATVLFGVLMLWMARGRRSVA